MYPYLLNGLKDIGGLSATPKNLDSFCGSFINLVFAVSSQFAGAIATGEFLMYFDHFAMISLGNDYMQCLDDIHEVGYEVKRLSKKYKCNLITKDDIKNLKVNDEDRDAVENLLNSEKDGSFSDGTRTIRSILHQKFQQIVYSINQPAAARSYQSTFWNISYFDKYYFDGMFGEFRFPNGEAPVWESLNKLQKEFMKWFNNERTKTVLTFPKLLWGIKIM
jgi:ribonucleoside-triphosphate reductase